MTQTAPYPAVTTRHRRRERPIPRPDSESPAVSVPLSLLLDASLKPTDRLIWMVLDTLPAPRESEIADLLGLHVHTVVRSIRRLRDADWVLVVPRCIDRANSYVTRHKTKLWDGRLAKKEHAWREAAERTQAPPPDPAFYDSSEYMEYLKELCAKPPRA